MSNFQSLLKEVELIDTTSVDLTSLLSLSKLQTRVPEAEDFEDDLYNLYLPAAIELVEKTAEIIITEKTYSLFLADFPSYYDFCTIRIEKTPITSVVYLKYKDADGDWQTIDSGDYELWLNSCPPRIVIPAENIPSLYQQGTKVVEVQYEGGYDNMADVPAPQKLILLELVAFWYQNREAFSVRGYPSEGAQGRAFDNLLDACRWRVYP